MREIRHRAASLILACAVSTCCAVPVLAATAAPLRGKNLALTWTDQRVEKILGSERERSLTQSSAVTVYISSEGRFFSHLTRTVGRGFTNVKDVSGAGRTTLNWRLSGTTLAADQQFLRGARRLIVTFDAGFQSCSLKVLHGKEMGASAIQYLTMDSKQPVELSSINVTSTNCTIAAGNPFS